MAFPFLEPNAQLTGGVMLALFVRFLCAFCAFLCAKGANIMESGGAAGYVFIKSNLLPNFGIHCDYY